jgi:hypothetical protein
LQPSAQALQQIGRFADAVEAADATLAANVPAADFTAGGLPKTGNDQFGSFTGQCAGGVQRAAHPLGRATTTAFLEFIDIVIGIVVLIPGRTHSLSAIAAAATEIINGILLHRELSGLWASVLSKQRCRSGFALTDHWLEGVQLVNQCEQL